MLGYEERRAISIRSALMVGKDTVGVDAVLRRYQVTEEEFDLILVIEDELGKIEREKADG